MSNDEWHEGCGFGARHYGPVAACPFASGRKPSQEVPPLRPRRYGKSPWSDPRIQTHLHEGTKMTNETDEQFSVTRGGQTVEPPLLGQLRVLDADVVNALRALDSLTRTTLRPLTPAEDAQGLDPFAELARLRGEARAYRKVLGYPEGDLDE